MNDKGYNGWTNYETWLANLWIDNDWRMSESFAMQAGDLLGSYEEDEAAERLSGRIEEFFDELRPDIHHGFFADVINASMREVNWREIAWHYVVTWQNEESLEEEEEVSDESRSYGPHYQGGQA
jgi:hypothetical protein